MGSVDLERRIAELEKQVEALRKRLAEVRVPRESHISYRVGSEG